MCMYWMAQRRTTLNTFGALHISSTLLEQKHILGESFCSQLLHSGQGITSPRWLPHVQCVQLQLCSATWHYYPFSQRQLRRILRTVVTHKRAFGCVVPTAKLQGCNFGVNKNGVATDSRVPKVFRHSHCILPPSLLSSLSPYVYRCVWILRHGSSAHGSIYSVKGTTRCARMHPSLHMYRNKQHKHQLTHRITLTCKTKADGR